MHHENWGQERCLSPVASKLVGGSCPSCLPRPRTLDSKAVFTWVACIFRQDKRIVVDCALRDTSLQIERM